jgi:hypothetical protein
MQSQSRNQEQIRVVRDITYGMILSGEVAHHSVLEAQVCEWIIRPARHLAALRDVNIRDTDHGIALLSLLMLFFEPHGQYLSGRDSRSTSQITFESGLQRFLNWLHSQHRLALAPSTISSEDFYKFARCGLLHSAQLKGEFLVDAKCLRNESIYHNNHLGSGWLINPWRLLEDLEDYFKDYIMVISDSSHADYASLRTPFDASFKRLVLDVLSGYA